MHVAPTATGTAPGGGAEIAARGGAHRLDQLRWSVWHRRLLGRLSAVGAMVGFAWGTGLSTAATRLSGSTGTDSMSTMGSTVGVSVAGLAGLCGGALAVGRLADRFGRRQLTLLGLGVCVLGAAVAAVATPAWHAGAWTWLVAASSGGVMTALLPGAAELAPARLRGTWVQAVAASSWIGLAAGTGAGAAVAEPWFVAGLLSGVPAPRILLGAVAATGLAVLIAARVMPESPRWLYARGRAAEAREVVALVERQASGSSTVTATGSSSGAAAGATGRSQGRPVTPATRLGRLRLLALLCPPPIVVGATLLPAPLVLQHVYGVPRVVAILSLVPLAMAGGLGAATLARITDTWGRRWVVFTTYTACAVTLVATAVIVHRDAVSPVALIGCWSLVLFLVAAGGGAMSASVYETAPLRARAFTGGGHLALGVVLAAAAGTAAMTAATSGTLTLVLCWYAAAALLMSGAAVAWRVTVGRTGRPLEDGEATAAPPRGRPHPAGARAAQAVPVARQSWPRRQRIARFGYAPWASAASLPGDDPRRVADVARILSALGAATLSRVELEARVVTAYWQPGRFRAALRTALESGHVVEVANGRFARSSQAQGG